MVAVVDARLAHIDCHIVVRTVWTLQYALVGIDRFEEGSAVDCLAGKTVTAILETVYAANITAVALIVC